MTRPECDELFKTVAFPGRRRDLCECAAHDGSDGFPPRPAPSIEESNNFRIANGLSPILLSLSTPQQRTAVKSIMSPRRAVTPKYQGGVGTELKLLLAWFGQYATKGCNCEKHAEKMDKEGIEWCENNVPKILGWMREEAAKKNIAFMVDLGGESLVKQAIANAKESLKKTMQPPFPMERRGRNPFSYVNLGTPEFVTLERLQTDIRILASKIPPETSRIIGVARSGVGVAATVAMLLHLPLSIVRQSAGDLIDGGNGWRLTGNTGGKGPPVVIDDTVMTGNSFKHVMPIVWQEFPGAISAAVYVNPFARIRPNIYVRELPHPHLLEWNVFNSVFGPNIAVDFDGILCADCAPQDDDDGEQYRGFLLTATPKYMIRKNRVPLIVTARLERWRAETEQWLAAHGIAADRIIMGPWANNAERAKADIGAWKGGHFIDFMNRRRGIKPPLFIESDERQAKRIAQVSGGVVICPVAGRCFL